MKTITDADIRELRYLITKSNQKIETKLNDIEKKLNDIEKHFNEFHKKIIEITGSINTTNAAIEAIENRRVEAFSNSENRRYEAFSNSDKPITKQKLIYRAVFITIIIAIATGAITLLAGYH